MLTRQDLAAFAATTSMICLVTLFASLTGCAASKSRSHGFSSVSNTGNWNGLPEELAVLPDSNGAELPSSLPVESAVVPAAYENLQQANRIEDASTAVSSVDALPTITAIATIPGEDVTTWSDDQSGVFTLAQLEAMALQHNPSLRELAATTQKAAAFRTQVGLRANPLVGYLAQQLADEGTDQHLAFIEQEFVTGGKLELNRRVQNEAVNVQMLELEAQRYRVLTDIRIKFVETLAAQNRLSAIEEFVPVVSKGLELTELRLKAAEGSKIDVLQAQVQLYEIDLVRQQTRVDLEATWKEVAAMIGVPQLEQRRLEGTLPESANTFDWTSLAETMVASSPEYSSALARVSQARAELVRHGAQNIPNLQVQFGAGVDNGTNSGMMNLQLAAPIPVHNKNQGNIAAARAEYCRALSEVQRIENSIKSRLAAVSGQYNSAAAAVGMYAEMILPSAEESLELAEVAYKAGETSFLQVLVARRTYFDANLLYINAQSELAQAQASVDGFVLTGGLDSVQDRSGSDDLRGLTFGQQ